MRHGWTIAVTSDGAATNRRAANDIAQAWESRFKRLPDPLRLNEWQWRLIELCGVHNWGIISRSVDCVAGTAGPIQPFPCPGQALHPGPHGATPADFRATSASGPGPTGFLGPVGSRVGHGPWPIRPTSGYVPR